MRQVKKDSERIHTQMTHKKYHVTLIILTSLVVLLSVVLLVTDNITLAKWMILAELIICSTLLHVSVKSSKITNQDYKNQPDAPLWIPRTFGYGTGLNPYNKVGSIWTVVLLITFDLLFLGLGILILFFV